MEYESTKLIIEGIAVCILYIVTMVVLIMRQKESWIQEYPDKVQDVYLEGRIDASEIKKTKKNYLGRLFTKKVIALGIYVAVTLVVMCTVEYKAIFLTENFLGCFLIWPVVTLVEALFLDVLIIGHWKRIRLPGTEALKAEYKGIYKKALKDVLLGLLFLFVVYWVFFCISMVALQIKVYKTQQELVVLERELEELQNGSEKEDDGDLSIWNNEAESSLWDEETNELQESADELNEIANEFEEVVKNIQQVVEYKEGNVDATHLNDGRVITRERPVFAGESLWSIAQKVYGDPYMWTDIYEANRTLLGEDPSLLYKDQYLTLPDTGEYDYTGYEYCYEEAVKETWDWEGLTEYIAPDCGYEVQNCIFYYDFPESNGEAFRICYPKLISLNGKDMTAINEGIRQRALVNADYLLMNRDEELAQKLATDERYSNNWTQDQVNYVITYLDEDTISVVFQYYVFEGSIYAEYLELRSYVADINTGKRYKTTELLTGLEDGKVAEMVNEEILAFYEKEEKKFQKWAFTEVMTPELINETLQTGLIVDGRYYSNVYLTSDGVGIGFTYRMNKEVNGYSKILRGWKAITIPKEEVQEYLTDASVWGK